MITYLGPLGATFSERAYRLLSEKFDTPRIDADYANCIPALKNGDIIPTIIRHGGYGAIAMQTRAEGRVAEPLESYITLLEKHPSGAPISILGALQMRISFALMSRIGSDSHDATVIIGHGKSLGACKKNIENWGIKTLEVSSNGLAAEMVATDEQYARALALGPDSAAKKYGLTVIESAFEDMEAVTTFFLIGPKDKKVVVERENRALIIFEINNRKGALKAVIDILAEINMIGIHSMHVENGSYHFSVEVECSGSDIVALENARRELEKFTNKCMFFGPFPVIQG